MTSTAVDPSLETPATPEQARERRPDLSLVRWLRVNPRYRLAILSLVVAGLLLGSAFLGYVCWFLWIPPVWRWGFEPPTWRGGLAFFGAFYLAIGPFVPFALSGPLLSGILNLYTEEHERKMQAGLAQLDVSKALTEESLAASDRTGLIALVRYSRLQLESYYTIGLGQSQRSFRYSILAMWIGFFIITGGILLYVLPVRSATEPAPNIQLLTIASGTVIELISALFLWIYRSSIGQLTYFYNRQMYLHSVLVAMRIADTMTDSDATKRFVVERILDPDAHAQPKLPALYRFRGGVSAESPTPSPTS